MYMCIPGMCMSYTTLHKVARAAWRTRAHHGIYMCIPCAGWAGIGACTHT